jgi:hypothetical protein
VIPYFKSIHLEPARMAALLFAVLAVGAQFGLHLSDPQLEAIKNLVSIVLGLFGAAELSRTKTISKSTAEAVATEALLTDPPASVAMARAEAKSMVAVTKAATPIPHGLALLAFLVAACTPAQTATATQVVDVSAVACEIIVSVVAPADVGLCVTADELGNAIISVLGSVQGQALAKTGDGKVVVPEAVFARLNASSRIRARRVKSAPCKPGTVAP